MHGGVNYDANDRFCMEGQRLVAISGTYGADSTVYRTEIDGFSKIVSYGTAGNGPSYFKVWTKSGQIMEFGNTTDSKILAVGSSTARSWAVDKISDTKGNYLTVTYINDTTNGQTYPSRIDYTGNANAGLSTYNSVQFSYNTSRPDVTPSYQAGSLQQTTVLLTDVKTYQGSNLVYDYQLAYNLGSATKHSELSKITLCDVNGACLAPTTFTWQGTRDTVAVTPVATTPSLAISYSYSATATNYSQSTWGDFNGDGLIDVLEGATAAQLGSNSYTTGIGVNLGTNTVGTFTATEYTATTPIPSCPNAICTSVFTAATSLGDVNADGLADISFQQIFNIQASGCPSSCQTPYYYAMTSNGSNAFTVSNLAAGGVAAGNFKGDGYQEYLGNAGVPPVPPSGTSAVVGDFDGDGCTDVLEQGGTNAILYSCNPAVSQVSVPYWTNARTYIGDFNGDGKTDILVVGSSGATLYLSTGKGLSAGYAIANSSSWYNDSIVVGDWNGDGKSDIAVVPPQANATVSVYLSTGTGFSLATSFTNTDQSTLLAALDMDNHGASDLAGNYTIYSIAYVPELMTSVNNGIGATTTISYDRLNKNGSLYTKCPSNPGTFLCGDTYPTLSLDGALYVVSRVDASNGIGGTYSSTYAYAGAKADLHGREFLGFSSMTVNDLQTGVVQTTNYHTDFPYVGLISSQTKTVGSVTLNSTNNTFANSNEGTGTEGTPYNFVSLSQSVVASNDLDGTAMPTSTTAYTYNSYGNAATVNVSLSDGSSKNTTNTFTNDTTTWFLGRLTNTSVTSTVPDTGTGGTSGVQPPVANNDSVTANENTPVTFDPRANDSDPSGYALTIIATSTPGHGTVAINSGTSLTYTPAANYSGSDSFTYTISDGQGHAATATVSVTVTYVAPPSGTLTASASPIAPGSSSTLTWTSSGATSASINNGVGNIMPVSGGTVSVSPSVTTTYTLTLTGLGGTTTKQVTVTVTPTPSGTFSASPTLISQGNTATLTWTSSNATSASINNGVGNVTPVAGGSVTVSPTASTTYTLDSHRSNRNLHPAGRCDRGRDAKRQLQRRRRHDHRRQFDDVELDEQQCGQRLDQQRYRQCHAGGRGLGDRLTVGDDDVHADTNQHSGHEYDLSNDRHSRGGAERLL